MLRLFQLAAVFLLLFLGIGGGTSAFAENPQKLLDQARSDLMTGIRILERADAMAKTAGSDEGQLNGAMALYAESGRLIESASNIYRALTPRYTSQKDIESCEHLVQRCVLSIQEIKKYLDTE